MRVPNLAFLLSLSLLSLNSCSPIYVIRAAYEESKILLASRDIKAVLQNRNTTEQERHKLTLVLAARDFAKSLGLNPKKSFTKYTRIEGDVLSWVVVAARKDSFELHSWWFPIVGSVPYKGFFDKEDALTEQRRLEKLGYESSVRGAEAFSTLGWFNDPVLSTTLKHDDLRIVNTVIHESVHSTVWIPDHVDFNESLANFVGFEGAKKFYQQKSDNCTACEEDHTLAQLAVKSAEREIWIADLIDKLYRDLDTLYKSNKSAEEKITGRVSIYAPYREELFAKFPGIKLLDKLNNAEIMQLKLYLTNLKDFGHLFTSCGQDWQVFIGKIREIKEQVEKEKQTDPFVLLKNLHFPNNQL